MATTIDTATVTATDINEPIVRRSGRTSLNGTKKKTSPTKAINKPPARVRRKYKHVAAVHSRSQPSCLSHDSTEQVSFVGFRNLMVIVLVVGNLRLMIENINKYGVLICIRCGNIARQDVILGAITYLLVPSFLFIAYSIELYASIHAKASLKQKRDGTSTPTDEDQKKFLATWKLIAWVHGTNASLCLLITSIVVYYHIHHPLIGFFVELHAIIVWLKTASYALTNRDLRHAYLHPSLREENALPDLYKECPYPENITLRNLGLYWFFPTLVYQPVYPRTETIRWFFVFKRLLEVFLLTVFIWVVGAQYAAPVLRNSFSGMAAGDLVSILERLLKLSTVSLILWLAGFFALFHSFLNALAEVMRFGDRSFYLQWWESPSLALYWTRWNTPVYSFMKRHVYVPMIGRGFSPTAASIGVFVFSGFLHELMVGIPTHNILGVAFLGMVGQIPLIAITKPFEKMTGHYPKILGNSIFWISFTIFGQPLCALLYFYAWKMKFSS